MSQLLSRVEHILEQGAAVRFPVTDVSRGTYLDLIEQILNVAVTWQDDRGAIIDPVAKVEHGQTSCRFVSPGAVLLSAGRGKHLREQVLRGMDWCCARLASGEGDSPDFWMRELMTAYTHLTDVEPARRAKWAAAIASVDCEKIYKFVSPDGSKLLTLHNWTVYAAAGEAMREMAGLGPKEDAFLWGRRFFEKYMPAQMTHFTDYGMYRDPGDPMTYDFTTRLQLSTALALGFESPSVGTLSEHLQRGMLAQLLYVSPEGFAPFGGRSNQLNMQEAILTASCEIESSRYRGSKPQLARVFKRQARLHARSILRWLTQMKPMRHAKSGFDPSTMHGCEEYAKYSVYSLFTASCLALAYQFADDGVEEAPATPAEIGGYAFELQGAFHKVFASVGRTHIEIDTKADFQYDATGLGRFHRAGVPLELGLSMPFPAHPKFIIPRELLPESNFAIGPGWKIAGQWTDLASLSEKLVVQTEVEKESLDEVRLHLVWTHEPSKVVVHQRYSLKAGSLRIDAEISSPQPIEAMRFIVPLLQTDGAETTQMDEGESQTVVKHGSGAMYTVGYSKDYKRSALPPAANRNGVYRPLVLETASSRMSIELKL